MKMIYFFNFGEHVVEKYVDFDYDPSKTFEEQRYTFKEDIIQISYVNNLTLDVGFYPEGNPKGFFRTFIIKDCDWEHPLKSYKAKTVDKMLKDVEKGVAYIQKLLSEQIDDN